MTLHRVANLWLLLAAVLSAAPAAHAESFASSASSASSASIGSLSTSIGKSSDASSKGGQVAAGEYRVVAVAALDGQPGMLRVRLRALDEKTSWREFDLHLPEQAVPAGGLGAGQAVTVGARDYGFAFARTGAAEAFFLVLEDGWFRELRNRPVAL